MGTVIHATRGGVPVAPRAPRDLYTLFLHHLLGTGRGGLDRAASLADLHRRWCQEVLGLLLARTTGAFSPPLPADRDSGAWQARRDALDRIVALDRHIDRLNIAARKAKQMPRRAELNVQLQTCCAEKDRLLGAQRT